jgi:hypothetical protein
VQDHLMSSCTDCLGQLDEFGIATGAEREELEAKREVKDLLVLLAGTFCYHVHRFLVYFGSLADILHMNCRAKSDLIWILLVDPLEPM